MRSLSNKEKKLIYAFGGINVYSVIEAILYVDKVIAELEHNLNNHPIANKNIDYNIDHDPNGYIPGYFN